MVQTRIGRSLALTKTDGVSPLCQTCSPGLPVWSRIDSSRSVMPPRASTKYQVARPPRESGCGFPASRSRSASRVRLQCRLAPPASSISHSTKRAIGAMIAPRRYQKPHHLSEFHVDRNWLFAVDGRHRLRAAVVDRAFGENSRRTRRSSGRTFRQGSLLIADSLKLSIEICQLLFVRLLDPVPDTAGVSGTRSRGRGFGSHPGNENRVLSRMP